MLVMKLKNLKDNFTNMTLNLNVSFKFEIHVPRTDYRLGNGSESSKGKIGIKKFCQLKSWLTIILMILSHMNLKMWLLKGDTSAIINLDNPKAVKEPEGIIRNLGDRQPDNKILIKVPQIVNMQQEGAMKILNVNSILANMKTKLIE